MNNLNIIGRYNSIDIDVEFQVGVNLIHQDSGTGKTFLFSILDECCRERNLSFHLFNYNDIGLRKEIILDICMDNDVLCFDNADLYLTSDLYEMLKKLNKIIVVSMKNISRLDTRGSMFCMVEYSRNSLIARKYKQ